MRWCRIRPFTFSMHLPQWRYKCVCTLHKNGLLFPLAQSRRRDLVAFLSCLCVSCYSLSLTLQPQFFFSWFHSVPLADVGLPVQEDGFHFDVAGYPAMKPLGTTCHFAITIVCYFFNFQDGLRPTEAQIFGFNDPRRTTGGYRRHIYVLTAYPEGGLASSREMGVLSHHLV